MQRRSAGVVRRRSCQWSDRDIRCCYAYDRMDVHGFAVAYNTVELGFVLHERA